MKVPASLQDMAPAYPEPGPPNTDHIQLEDSASRSTMELLLPPFRNEGRETNTHMET